MAELKAFPDDETRAVIARGFALHAAAITPQEGATIGDVIALAERYADYILTGAVDRKQVYDPRP